MKKLLVLLSILLVVLGLTACSSTPATEEETEEPTGYEIALVTDIGTIDDKSFNQGAQFTDSGQSSSFLSQNSDSAGSPFCRL